MSERGREGKAENIIFVCPVTNKKVQHRIEVSSDQQYESVACLSCSGLHFIDLRTGNVLQRG